jgi:CBS domain-containing protein
MGKKVTTTSPNTLLTEAAEIMFRNKFGCLPVTEDGKLVGILTEADFVKSFMEWNVRFR